MQIPRPSEKHLHHVCMLTAYAACMVAASEWALLLLHNLPSTARHCECDRSDFRLLNCRLDRSNTSSCHQLIRKVANTAVLASRNTPHWCGLVHAHVHGAPASWYATKACRVCAGLGAQESAKYAHELFQGIQLFAGTARVGYSPQGDSATSANNFFNRRTFSSDVQRSAKLPKPCCRQPWTGHASSSSRCRGIADTCQHRARHQPFGELITCSPFILPALAEDRP